MKKLLSIFLCLMLVCSFCTTAFAEDVEPAADENTEEVVEEVAEEAEEVAEETEEVVEVAEAPEEVAEEPTGEEAPAEEAEEAPAEETEEAVEEEPATTSGNKSANRALIIALVLLAFGGGVIFLGNQKSKGPKKPAKKKD